MLCRARVRSVSQALLTAAIAIRQAGPTRTLKSEGTHAWQADHEMQLKLRGQYTVWKTNKGACNTQWPGLDGEAQTLCDQG